MLPQTRLHPLKETQKQSRQHYKDPIQKHEKTQSASFRRLLFPKTFWITKTYIVLYFPKPWNCNHKTTELQYMFVLLPAQFSDLYENIIFLLPGNLMLSRTRLHPLKETQKQSRQHYKDPLQKHEKTQSTSFFRLLFPNTFWITKTYIVLYFPKPWNCNHQQTEFLHLSVHILLNSWIENLYFYYQET